MCWPLIYIIKGLQLEVKSEDVLPLSLMPAGLG